ncbi:hypothetical protein HJFPF1_09899 [Paramyrothecium foliicola]|nr:hypothetical protein HJFPF1_09899 [Paramyrothecium foliicola]
MQSRSSKPPANEVDVNLPHVMKGEARRDEASKCFAHLAIAQFSTLTFLSTLIQLSLFRHPSRLVATMIINRSIVLALAAVITTARASIPDCVSPSQLILVWQWDCHQTQELRSNSNCTDIWDDVCAFGSADFGNKFEKCIQEECPKDFVEKNPHFVKKLMEAFQRLDASLPLTRRDDDGDDVEDAIFPVTAPPCAVYSLTNLAATAGPQCPLNQPFGACVCQVHLAEKEVLSFCASHIDHDSGRLQDVLSWIRSICSEYTDADDKPEDLQGDTVEELTIGSGHDVTDKEAEKIVKEVKDKAQKEAKKQKDKVKDKADELKDAKKKEDKVKDKAKDKSDELKGAVKDVEKQSEKVKEKAKELESASKGQAKKHL